MKSKLEKQYQEYVKHCLMESIPPLTYAMWLEIYKEFELENA